LIRRRGRRWGDSAIMPTQTAIDVLNFKSHKVQMAPTAAYGTAAITISDCVTPLNCRERMTKTMPLDRASGFLVRAQRIAWSSPRKRIALPVTWVGCPSPSPC
jgi:hypothetical protein